ncbi:hypothetical protein [Leptothoe kymatousa]|nr:hypothetical protein [Leptothoe kymatousa]
MAQAISTELDVALTSFYDNPEEQKQKVDVLKTIGFDVSIPLNVKDLSHEQLGSGTFQSADLDFSDSIPNVPNTDARIAFSGPLTTVNGQPATSILYAVVAGKPNESSCPISIEDTQISFFDSESEANDRGEKLSNQGYLVYVSVDKKAQMKALEKINELNCRPDARGIVVDGATQKVTVDFSDVSSLLPRQFQQAAKNSPFVYSPKGRSIYLANARKVY